MTRRPRRQAAPGRWPLTLALILALIIALGGLGPLLVNAGWWFTAALVGSAVLLAAAITRSLTDRAALPTVAALVTGVVSVTLLYAPGVSLLGIIPTPGTIAQFGDLVTLGVRSISTQSVPATATTGIAFLVAASAGAVAVVLEILVFVLRKPALSGILLFGILAVPGFIDSALVDPVLFVLTAAAWLLVLAASGGTLHPGLAARLAVTGIVGALVLSLVLPPVDPANQPTARGAAYATGINPMIDLGDDLRRDTPQLALTYTTTAERDQYFTLATLDEFSDFSWQPTRVEFEPGTTLERFDPAPGRAEEIEVVESSTTITIGNINGRWLPVPYVPVSVAGLDSDDWGWEPGTLSVRSPGSNIRGLEYEVLSQTARPTVVQLRGAGEVPPAVFERFLELPESLPASVAQTAAEVTAAGETPYDKAVLLQSFFRSGDFEYSEQSPVDRGYDVVSPRVIGVFLEVKSGYCVHFSSAMAAMARSVGIPSRIAVGFTAGSAEPGSSGAATVYTVTTDNLHAWPELYFDSVGWVRFEPTVGRGSVQTFPAGTTTDGSEGLSPTTPGAPGAPMPEGVPLPDVGLGEDPGVVEEESLQAEVLLAILLVAILILLALSPANARAVRRRLRLRRVAATGAAGPAWLELVDTVHDLTRAEPPALTPSEFADTLDESMATAALGRLRAAIEAQSFARDAAAHDDSADVLAADLHDVLAGLRHAASSRDRVLALLLPVSELRRWERALVRVLRREGSTAGTISRVG